MTLGNIRCVTHLKRANDGGTFFSSTYGKPTATSRGLYGAKVLQDVHLADNTSLGELALRSGLRSIGAVVFFLCQSADEEFAAQAPRIIQTSRRACHDGFTNIVVTMRDKQG